MGEKFIIEEIAKILYFSQEGCNSAQEFFELFGFNKKLWITDAPWDSNENELCEWERDEYRAQAKLVIDKLKEMNIIKLC